MLDLSAAFKIFPSAQLPLRVYDELGCFGYIVFRLLNREDHVTGNVLRYLEKRCMEFNPCDTPVWDSVDW